MSVGNFYVVGLAVSLGATLIPTDGYAECGGVPCMDRIEVVGQRFPSPWMDPYHNPWDVSNNWMEFFDYDPYNPSIPAEPKDEEDDGLGPHCALAITESLPFTYNQAIIYNYQTSQRQFYGGLIGMLVGGGIGTIGVWSGWVPLATGTVGIAVGHELMTRPLALCGHRLRTETTTCLRTQGPNAGTYSTSVRTRFVQGQGDSCQADP